MSGARMDYLKWEEYFMSIARIAADRSKDPDLTQRTGACIVGKDNTILGVGYNGHPLNGEGLNNEVSWHPLWKHKTMIHAPANAIDFKKGDVSGATIYLTHFPCTECVKNIAAQGISHVVFKNIGNCSETYRAMAALLDAGLKVQKFEALTEHVNFDGFKGNVVPIQLNN